MCKSLNLARARLEVLVLMGLEIESHVLKTGGGCANHSSKLTIKAAHLLFKHSHCFILEFLSLNISNNQEENSQDFCSFSNGS